MSGWAAAGAAAGGLLGGIINNERNLAYQREAFDYMKEAQQKTWDREDSAVQRRVNDLRLAGLSPVLAAGSAAQAGSPTKIDPLHSEDPVSASISGMVAGAQTQQSVAATAAAEQQTKLLEAQTLKTNVEAGIAGKELGLYQNTGGHPKYSSGFMKNLKDAFNSAADLFPKTAKTLKEDIDSVNLKPKPGESVADYLKRKHTTDFFSGGK